MFVSRTEANRQRQQVSTRGAGLLSMPAESDRSGDDTRVSVCVRFVLMRARKAYTIIVPNPNHPSQPNGPTQPLFVYLAARRHTCAIVKRKRS